MSYDEQNLTLVVISMKKDQSCKILKFQHLGQKLYNFTRYRYNFTWRQLFGPRCVMKSASPIFGSNSIYFYAVPTHLQKLTFLISSRRWNCSFIGRVTGYLLHTG